MKIICSACKTILGEQKPFDDPSEIKAKCTSCLAKEKEAALKALVSQPMPEPGKQREVIFENGWKGILSVAGKETEAISFWDLLVAGRKFFCSKDTREECRKYLDGIAENEVDVMFIHSSTIKLDKPLRGRKKKKVEQVPPETEKSESINYNCTVRAPKQFVLPMFDEKTESLKQFTEIMVEVALRTAREERLKTEALSGGLDGTSPNSPCSKELRD
jgi:hypothetical protein